MSPSNTEQGEPMRFYGYDHAQGVEVITELTENEDGSFSAEFVIVEAEERG